MASRLVAAGRDWRVADNVCSAGPHDRPFEEQHDAASIAAVTAGTFKYRTTQGSALMAPGALLLGNMGQHFECRHEHHHGDRCLSFHFAPELLEEIARTVPGVKSFSFNAPRVPPLTALVPLLTEAAAARDSGDGAALEEIALRVAGTT
ncbi:MAG: AraC family ligand binding domain-containing protein, partial [Gammaproteobacteria bacterium]